MAYLKRSNVMYKLIKTVISWCAWLIQFNFGVRKKLTLSINVCN